MAIRSLRKKMKPVIWMITIAFFIAAAAGSVSSIKSIMANKRYAFKINGEKVAIQDVERGINNVNSQYGQYFQTPMEREDAKILAIDNIISNEIIKKIGSELKIKVSSDEVKTKVSAIEAQFPAKDQFKRMLMAQGYTKSTFEKSIKDSILVEKTINKIIEKTEVSDEEIAAQYEKNKYSKYLGKAYEEVKADVEKELKKEKGNKELIKLIEKEKRVAKIDDIRENYGNIKPTVEFEENGFKITNVDIIKESLYQSFYGVKNYNEARSKAVESIKEEIKLAKKALDRGAKKDEELPTMYQIMDLKSQLIDDVRANIKVNDEVLKKFFNENKKVYDIEASADANIINFIVKATDLDEKKAQEKADKLLKEVTAENFSEMAKKYSEGPSGPTGGELGWFGKGQMIPEFEDAAFKGEVGKVYPEIVKSKFGYHLIYVEDKRETDGKEEVKASHILIKVTPGEVTYAKVMGTAEMVAKEIKDGKTTFEEESKKEYSKFKTAEYLNIKKDGYIQNIGYDQNLVDAIFETPLNEVKVIKTENGIYVFEKTKEVKYESATFEKVKDRVIFDYKNQKLMEEMQNL